MAKEYAQTLKTLLDCMGDQKEHRHSQAVKIVSIPTVWRTRKQRSVFQHRWSGVQETQQVREPGFLEAFRKELKATALFRLALVPESPYPHLLSTTPDVDPVQKHRNLAGKIISQVREWPTTEFRRVAEFASEAGNGSPLKCAMIRFPSVMFEKISHEGIKNIVLTFLPERNGEHASAYQQIFGIVNGGTSELGCPRQLKTQHENLACQLIYNLRKGAEDVWSEAQATLNRAETETEVSVVLHCLRQQAEAARDCSYKLPDNWSYEFLAAVLHEFSVAVERFLSSSWDETQQSIMVTARERLTELGAWLGCHEWLDILLTDNRFRRKGMLLINTIAEICSPQSSRYPITLQSVVQTLLQHQRSKSGLDKELNAANIRELFKSHLTPSYSEQDCTAVVLDTYKSRARIEVQGSNEGEMFRTSVPLTSFPDRPEIGDQYELVVWDLWHHWFGITAAKKTGSAIPRWTRQQRRKFKQELKDIQFGTVVERGGKS